MFNASDLHQKYSSIAVANNSQAHLKSPFEKKLNPRMTRMITGLGVGARNNDFKTASN